MKWVHFPLHPDTPVEGRSLEELFKGRDVDVDAMYRQMKARMDEEGLPYGQRTHTYNSRLAQEVGAWADATAPDKAPALHDAMYRAYFVDAKNVGDPDVLMEIVASVGLDVEAARSALDARAHKADVDKDWEKSRSMGVTGVPTFVAGGYGVVGAQPYEVLEQLIEKAKTDPRV